jgi:hypothetical protein
VSNRDHTEFDSLFVTHHPRIDEENPMLHAQNDVGSDLGRITANEFAAYFRHLGARVERAATSVTEDQSPIQTRLGLFLVCAAHMNNHIGQMSYLVQAFQSSSGEPPIW